MSSIIFELYQFVCLNISYTQVKFPSIFSVSKITESVSLMNLSFLI